MSSIYNGGGEMKNKIFLMATILFLFFINPVSAQDEKGESLPQMAQTQGDSQIPAVINLGQKNKISLDIKGMDITDVLKMLAQRCGINIVIGKNVAGRVTLFLKDVDVEDVFEIILLANELAYERKGDIINVMTQRDYELLYGERYQDKKQVEIVQLKYAKAAGLAQALNQIKTNLGKIVVDEGSNTLVLIDAPEKIKEMKEFIQNTDLLLETRIFSLNYASADKLNPKLQEAITKGVGSIRIDERTNKIAVADYPEKLKEIAKIITAFDEKTPQVLIDAQVIEIKPSDKFEMGVDWDYWIRNHFRITSNLPIGTTGRLLLGTTASTPTSTGQYKAVVDLLRTIGDTKILSSPRIMVLNNQEAKIHVGTKDAFITSTTSQGGTGTTVTSQSVNFVDTGLQIFVTPTINRDGFITMKIKPEVSSAVRTDITSQGQVTQIPIVTTSEAETTIMVKDGVTVIIGGLKKDERNKEVRKIPVLGDIPLLGFFFRRTSDEFKKSELVILLTPHIMSGETTYSDFSEIKPKDGAVAKMEKGDIIIEKMLPPDTKGIIWEYYKSVNERVKAAALFSNLKREKGVLEICFGLSSDGQIKDGPRILSSSNQNLDKIVIECIKKISPFPPFPKELNKGEENFQVTLEYK